MEVSTTALIDSGATASFLPREIAIDILNLPITHRDLPVEGAGGMFMCDVVRAKQISVMKGVNSIHEYDDRFMHIPKALFGSGNVWTFS